VTKLPVRERLRNAAFALFDEQGYEQTTVDDIAERAGVGRTTLFRSFQSKEDLIFPDHSLVLRRVAERLAASSPETAAAAIREGARLVLMHYIAEGERARSRYRLTSTVSALRDREIANARQYQRLFRDFIERWLASTDLAGAEDAALRAEITAAAVVAAHNHVLRRWLRQSCDQPEAEFDTVFGDAGPVLSLLTGVPPVLTTAAAQPATSAVLLRAIADLERLLPALRSLLDVES
jgi:AcrR family transcriptional regulator